jgi:hypothetical protein
MTDSPASHAQAPVSRGEERLAFIVLAECAAPAIAATVVTGASQAPMASVAHFMDRDGNFLAVVSPRRHLCDQCHVVQTH